VAPRGPLFSYAWMGTATHVTPQTSLRQSESRLDDFVIPVLNEGEHPLERDLGELSWRYSMRTRRQAALQINTTPQALARDAVIAKSIAKIHLTCLDSVSRAFK
jgi:hypothetical protein